MKLDAESLSLDLKVNGQAGIRGRGASHAVCKFLLINCKPQIHVIKAKINDASHVLPEARRRFRVFQAIIEHLTDQPVDKPRRSRMLKLNRFGIVKQQ